VVCAGSPKFLAEYFRPTGFYGLKKCGGLPLVVRDKRSVAKETAAEDRNGVAGPAEWLSAHADDQSRAIAATDVFYTKNAQVCLDKYPMLREVASKGISHWMCYIIRKRASFWAGESLNGAYVGGAGSYEKHERELLRTYLDECYSATENGRDYVHPGHVFNGPCKAVPAELKGIAEHLFSDETFVAMQVGDCLHKAHGLIKRRTDGVYDTDELLLRNLKKINLTVHLPKVMQKVSLAAGAAAAHKAIGQPFPTGADISAVFPSVLIEHTDWAVRSFSGLISSQI